MQTTHASSQVPVAGCAPVDGTHSEMSRDGLSR